MAKLDPYKHLATGREMKTTRIVRPGLAGVYHVGGKQYASDGYSLIRIRQDYPKQYDGKIIDKYGKEVFKIDPQGRPVEPATPVKYETVIPTENELKKDWKPYSIDLKEMEAYAKSLSRDNRSSKSDGYKYITLKNRESGDELASFDPKYILRAIDFMKAENTEVLYLNGRARPAFAKNGEDIVMIMPVTKEWASGKFLTYHVVPSYGKKKQGSATSRKTSSAKTQVNMTRKRTTTKARRSANTTMREASRILKSQKEDYQRIFRSEVKKSKDPKKGAKKAGKIYRDRYGSTATARWKRAVRKANLPTR